MIEKCGRAEKITTQLKKPGKDAEKIDVILEMLELLIAQGCAYKNYFEKDIPAPDNAPIVEGKWTPLPKDALSIAIGVYDAEELAEKIQECISKGGTKEVEAKPEGKNANATQG